MCLKEKPRIEFYHNISCADGLAPKCIECSKKYHKIYMREYRKKKKKDNHPFIYYPRLPGRIIPDPKNLEIINTPFTHQFD